MRRYDEGSYEALESRKPPGAKPVITHPGEEDWLEETVLNSTPVERGYDTNLWTRDLVCSPGHTELDRVRLIVERCARGAAIASDVEVRSQVRQGYRAMKNNLTLARCFGSHLEVLGRHVREVDTRLGAGSTDMGDVSQVIPAIHPGLAIVDEGKAFCHEPRFATAAGSDQGLQTALLAAKALARTAIEVIGDGAAIPDL